MTSAGCDCPKRCASIEASSVFPVDASPMMAVYLFQTLCGSLRQALQYARESHSMKVGRASWKAHFIHS